MGNFRFADDSEVDGDKDACRSSSVLGTEAESGIRVYCVDLLQAVASGEKPGCFG